MDKLERGLRRDQKLLLVLAVIFFLPLLASWLWFLNVDDFRPQGSVAHGTLVQPVRVLEGYPEGVAVLRGRWVMVYVGTRIVTSNAVTGCMAPARLIPRSVVMPTAWSDCTSWWVDRRATRRSWRPSIRGCIRHSCQLMTPGCLRSTSATARHLRQDGCT